ncbi:GNAT family N-acetyltransferase [Kribbella sp. NPDC051586]|uniref:GNAT family N-acetyltransferase n=1 Tax=Kribbella sp. NPDC051586 TaxID=3364118 RepID=UPI00379C0313
MEIDVRTAIADDVAGLVASTAALFAEDGAARDRLRNPEWPVLHGRDWYAGLMADPAALVVVAAAGPEVVGHLVGTYADCSEMWLAPRAELVSMFVAPRRRTEGIGSHMVGRFTDWARERGAARIQVDAYAANERALRFYRRHGFTRLSESLAADL